MDLNPKQRELRETCIAALSFVRKHWDPRIDQKIQTLSDDSRNFIVLKFLEATDNHSFDVAMAIFRNRVGTPQYRPQRRYVAPLVPVVAPPASLPRKRKRESTMTTRHGVGKKPKKPLLTDEQREERRLAGLEKARKRAKEEAAQRRTIFLTFLAHFPSFTVGEIKDALDTFNPYYRACSHKRMPNWAYNLPSNPGALIKEFTEQGLLHKCLVHEESNRRNEWTNRTYERDVYVYWWVE